MRLVRYNKMIIIIDYNRNIRILQVKIGRIRKQKRERGKRRERERRKRKTPLALPYRFQKKRSDKHLTWDICRNSVYANRGEEFVIFFNAQKSKYVLIQTSAGLMPPNLPSLFLKIIQRLFRTHFHKVKSNSFYCLEVRSRTNYSWKSVVSILKTKVPMAVLEKLR